MSVSLPQDGDSALMEKISGTVFSCIDQSESVFMGFLRYGHTLWILWKYQKHSLQVSHSRRKSVWFIPPQAVSEKENVYSFNFDQTWQQHDFLTTQPKDSLLHCQWKWRVAKYFRLRQLQTEDLWKEKKTKNWTCLSIHASSFHLQLCGLFIGRVAPLAIHRQNTSDLQMIPHLSTQTINSSDIWTH